VKGKGLMVKKLFSNGKNAVIVAIDHRMFDGPLPGMNDLSETTKR
jgi:DhnA family fructose-bisphosphate aldolase class Ia